MQSPEMAGMAAGMAVEEFREQLREWREDGGRHSDEVGGAGACAGAFSA